jgi:hypothetical protein
MARKPKGPLIGQLDLGRQVPQRAKERSGRRGGGRAARVAQRQEKGAPQAVRPGLTGGAFQPLSDPDIARIHEAALDLLETIGIGDPTDELNEIVLAKGCHLNEHGRLCFPRALIEDVVIYARGSRSPDYDIRAGGRRVHFCTAGSAVTTFQYESKTYRPATLIDIYDFVRLIDQLDNIHLVGQPVIATDVKDLFAHDISVLYAQIAGTEKPLSMSFADRSHIKPGIEFFDLLRGLRWLSHRLTAALRRGEPGRADRDQQAGPGQRHRGGAPGGGHGAGAVGRHPGTAGGRDPGVPRRGQPGEARLPHDLRHVAPGLGPAIPRSQTPRRATRRGSPRPWRPMPAATGCARRRACWAASWAAPSRSL